MEVEDVTKPSLYNFCSVNLNRPWTCRVKVAYFLICLEPRISLGILKKKVWDSHVSNFGSPTCFEESQTNIAVKDGPKRWSIIIYNDVLHCYLDFDF